MSKFKIGDRVRIVESGWGSNYQIGDCGEILTIPTTGERSYRIMLDSGIILSGLWTRAFVKQETPQTSNEKPSFVSFFTSVIVAKNKAVSDIGELLYDENSTKISLEDEGGGAFIVVEQDYNGAIQQIRLDIDEVDTVFSAIKQLVNQLEGK